jgi:hypothetical protein
MRADPVKSVDADEIDGGAAGIVFILEEHQIVEHAYGRFRLDAGAQKPLQNAHRVA